ncbi:aminodeoxychorismate lyase [Silanimonas sp.]|uniref:aminodeoxychorismate lyase n=1 Tax=Silanimonas sp. TaxID=1929290 RepID=UPI0022C6437A|nr:aminodeoxychorismate lyase [Silanimonas sp.]MCZ8166153.1 aminodeoxychorismate lyase [Silanimonas sp.]
MGAEAIDRGLAYGDGLFETMRAHRGTLPWWPRHRARLTAGAGRLGITMPSDAALDAALSAALDATPNGVIKLILTRGCGGRGYAPTTGAEPTLIVTSSEGPAASVEPLAVDLLSLRLGVQPALAGMKHLNRLEQVLGAGEAAERGLDDGLMADADGFLTCSTRANLFARLDGRWITPPVDRAGVAGVARGVLLDAWSPPGGLHVMPLLMAVLPRVDALLLSNAVRGILPVGRCGAWALDPRPVGFAEARAALAASHPAFRES